MKNNEIWLTAFLCEEHKDEDLSRFGTVANRNKHIREDDGNHICSIYGCDEAVAARCPIWVKAQP